MSPLPAVGNLALRPLAALLVVAALTVCAAECHGAPTLDAAALARSGLRVKSGQHITLVTDRPLDATTDELIAVFDAAYEPWRQYFEVRDQPGEAWRATAYLMQSRDRFAQAGLLPIDLPPFLHGFARGDELWLDDQPSDYYRRHLLLHEGVHSFMHTRLGGIGAPWFAEGLAELLATHRWENGQLTVGYYPANKDEAPYWGRVRMVNEAHAAGRRLTLDEVMNYGPQAHRQNETYGFCWALAALLDGDPRYQARFRALAKQAAAPDFNRAARQTFAHDWRDLSEQWDVYAAQLCYGYDVPRAAIQFARGKPLAGAVNVKLDAARGWQSTAIHVERGQKLRLSAAGRYDVSQTPKPWLCEPQGVTIHYVDGHPLGVVLAAIRPDTPERDARSAFLRPLVVGRDVEIMAPVSGTLYLRINDAPNSWSDNRGTIDVTARPVEP